MHLVTGAAGFIGFHTTLSLLREGISVLGLDSLNHYYDVRLKQARLEQLQKAGGDFTFLHCDIGDAEALAAATLPYTSHITHVVHLAAQAGVRYSFIAPLSYLKSNIDGQMNMLKLCEALPKLTHLVYASSSSVYGESPVPFKTSDRSSNPVSLYAASKLAGEIMAESHARAYGMPTTGLRFFTVYGPWGRPDMAYFQFTQAILAGNPIRLFNNGNMTRDFTYISDIVAGIRGALAHVPAPYAVYNLGNSKPHTLESFITTLEAVLGKKAVREYAPMQPGDVQHTFADIRASTRDLGFAPHTELAEGLQHFVQWYRHFYHAA